MSSDILDRWVEDTDWCGQRTRIISGMRNGNIHAIGELVEFSPQALLRTWGLGRHSVVAIIKTLRDLGVTLKDDAYRQKCRRCREDILFSDDPIVTAGASSGLVFMHRTMCEPDPPPLAIRLRRIKRAWVSLSPEDRAAFLQHVADASREVRT